MREEDVVGIAFGLAWLLWLPLLAVGAGWLGHAPPWLYPLGLAMPGVAAVIAVASDAREDGEVFAWLARQLDPRVDPRWLLLAATMPVMLFLAAVLVVSMVGPLPDLSGFGMMPLAFGDLSAPWSLVLWFLSAGLCGELGWRGWVLPRLLKQGTPLHATARLAVVWAAFLLPSLLFVPGLDGVLVGLVTIVSSLPITLLYTWLYGGSGGRVLVTATWSTSTAVILGAPGLAASPLGLTFVTLLAALAVTVTTVLGRVGKEGRAGASRDDHVVASAHAVARLHAQSGPARRLS